MKYTPGIYLLTIRLRRGLTCCLGRRECRLQAGWYVYAGSAMNGLEGRLGRHLRTSSVRHWHVDHLLAAGQVVDVQVCASRDRDLECRLAERVRNWSGAKSVAHFGASDCRCDSHLAWSAHRPCGSAHAPPVVAALPALYEQLRARYDDFSQRDRDPFRTLITCILSLRTRDPVTHAAAERLFAVFRTPAELATADVSKVSEIICPVGMFRRKAEQIRRISCAVRDEYDGRVPCNMDVLTALPGVGRKTANLVMSFAFHQPAVCVDTHVHRITNRWGLVRTTAPDETEAELRRCLPLEYWMETNPFLVQHGQQVCRPLKPECAACCLRQWCGYAELVRERQILAGVSGAPPHPSLKRIRVSGHSAGGKLGRTGDGRRS